VVACAPTPPSSPSTKNCCRPAHPHQRGDTVSLVERQIKLRDRNIEMRHRLSQLMDVARDNDRLFDKTRRLILDLMDAASLEDVVMAVEDSLRQDFQVPFVSLILFGDNVAPVGRWVSNAEAQPAIGGLLGGGKTSAAACASTSWTSCSANSASRSAPPPWSPSAIRAAWRAGHRQPRPAALQELVGTLFLATSPKSWAACCHALPRPCARYADGTATGRLLRTPAQRAPGVAAHLGPTVATSTRSGLKEHRIASWRRWTSSVCAA
jgi:hypothetical protein